MDHVTAPTITDREIAAFEALCPGGVEVGASLADLSQWRIGGRADLILRPGSREELASIRQFLHIRGRAHVVVGSTSNLLFADAGLRVPCIMIGDRMDGLTISGETIHAEAGVWVPGLAWRAMRAGLTGVEHICGIPGTFGGLVYMNGGSQRKGIGSSLVKIETVDATGVLRRQEPDPEAFAYRYSTFQESDEIIAGATLRLTRGDRAAIRAEMRRILADRRRKFPRKTPNCGSVFVSDPALYADYGPPGAIIEALGFKGRRVGGALVSPLHANFIVNTGGATAADVLTIIEEIRSATEHRHGRALVSEARYVAPNGTIHKASDVAAELAPEAA